LLADAVEEHGFLLEPVFELADERIFFLEVIESQHGTDLAVDLTNLIFGIIHKNAGVRNGTVDKILLKICE
jgi:hypothetical protein